ncbi:MAG TPA: translation elongation factor Ts [Nitrospinota bacterium]|nr:translation elongation factor Ts [Nitrospinota bacterium]|tara:strand:+ start:15584 stop:16459 length:876 start_codon:yes stop_codon:yes gene_type:complete
MSISAEMIKDLRQRSGAGIMECKEALKESDGDINAALACLRKKGSSKAAKKAERSTKEGAIGASYTDHVASLIEVKCETDFVARNDKFRELVSGLALHIANSDPAEDDDTFKRQLYYSDTSKTVESLITENIHELGENITLGRRARMEKPRNGAFGRYIHGVGSIAVLVEVLCNAESTLVKDKFKELCKDLAMQIAASCPLSVEPEGMAQDQLEKEREIYVAQAKESGKPDKIISKIVEGRIKKYFTEVCLMEQAFVKDTDNSVRVHMQSVSKTLGDEVHVSRFVRFQLGE